MKRIRRGQLDKPLIYNPNYLSEFEIQAHAFYLLKSAGLLVKGEVKASNSNYKRGARFDLVIFSSNGYPMLTIEVKRKANRKPHIKKNLYEIIGNCPNIQINGFKEADNILTHPSISPFLLL